MVRPDRFRRRTTDLGGLLRLVADAARRFPHVPGLLAGRTLDPALREAVMLAVTEVNACRWCAYVHEGLAEATGEPRGPEARTEAALAYARAAAAAGTLPPPGEAGNALREHFDAREAAAVDAAVALITVGNLAGNTVDSLLARLSGRRPPDLRELAREASVVALVLPVGLPVVAVAALLRQVAPSLRRRPAA